MSESSDHVPLTADKLKLVKKALTCPAKLIKSDGEKKFLAETKERLESFGERIYLSDKQFAWLEKIACRLSAKKPAYPDKAANAVDDLPSYEESAGG